MGNMQQESGFRTNNVEDRSGIQDEVYTANVDNGSYTRKDFMYDGGKAYGYGLCQWTFNSRKGGLYDFAKRRGVSIADEQMQIDWMVEEMHQAEFKSVYRALMTDSSLEYMTSKFMCVYENPEDQSDTAINYRVGLARAIYQEFAGRGPSAPEPSEPEVDDDGMPIPETWPPRTIDEHCNGWPEVWLLQAILRCRGYNVLVDGIFGSVLTDKVKQYQREHNLDPDGAVGPMSWASLLGKG